MSRHLPTLLLLYPLLAACGADSSNSIDTTESAANNSSPTQPQLSIDPCFYINHLAGSQGGGSGGVTITGLNLNGATINGLNLNGNTITITGMSAQTEQTETTLYQKRSPVAKDGIPLSISIGISDIFIAEDTDECEQPEYAYAVAVGLPTHDIGSFPNSENPFAVLEQGRVLRISLNPKPAQSPVALSSERLDGMLVNGVPIQMRESGCAFTCYILGDPNPLGAPAGYGIDDHNAHVLSDNSYHYHGDPKALYPEPASDGPTLIGVAADGYPIFGPWINDSGLIRKATSSYQLKIGSRPHSPFAPPSYYDGTLVGDFEYVVSSGDLDECNGMSIGGVYGYYVTDTFPYILNCFRGTPDPSFDLATE
ncbi:MAG: YHYH protein [Gammaproteobacteria bacterium]|jgi:hypothetical protein|nr:YHYH protein [Gammaproteobacteria bacterium]MBQ0773582.1 YHYH protein [Gammaproteobacteria bacterium]